MRCEKPWFASFGATKKTNASAVVTSTSELTASAGRGMRNVRPTAGIVAAAWLLGDDILERRPADDREGEVVEGEEPEIAAGRDDDARADRADDDRHGERQAQQRQEQVSRPGRDGHRPEEDGDGADAELRQRQRGHGRPAAWGAEGP